MGNKQVIYRLLNGKPGRVTFPSFASLCCSISLSLSLSLSPCRLPNQWLWPGGRADNSASQQGAILLNQPNNCVGRPPMLSQSSVTVGISPIFGRLDFRSYNNEEKQKEKKTAGSFPFFFTSFSYQLHSRWCPFSPAIQLTPYRGKGIDKPFIDD